MKKLGGIAAAIGFVALVAGCAAPAPEPTPTADAAAFCVDYVELSSGIEQIVNDALQGATRETDLANLQTLAGSVEASAPEDQAPLVAVLVEPLETLEASYAAGSTRVALPPSWNESRAELDDFCIAELS